MMETLDVGQAPFLSLLAVCICGVCAILEKDHDPPVIIKSKMESTTKYYQLAFEM